MNDIADKLTQLLNDPEGMERIKRAAESLLSGDKKEETAAEPEPSFNMSDFNMPDIDPSMIATLISTLGSAQPDGRSELLLALKPHLSAERQKRVDNAVRILKLIPLLPLVKQFI